MKRCKFLFGLSIALLAGINHAQAGRIYSEYTLINLDKDCKFFETDENGGSALCTGYKDVPVHFSEGDLRHQVRFGTIDKSYDTWETFGEFNNINDINDKIEWRITNGKPYAAILRWFINNEDPYQNTITQESRGNVLVISKVGTRQSPKSCIVGYIDTRANKNANLKARDVADDLARDFVCGEDLPKFHGKKGEWSGTPTNYAE